VTRIVRSDLGLATTPIVMLTARIEDNDKIVGLELGADDYVAKPFNPRELVARVRAVLRRAHGDLAPSRVVQAGPLVLDLDAHEVRLDDKPVELTRTEFGLLQALAEHPDRALTRLEMIERGLGYSYEGLERTVDSHVKNLRRSWSTRTAPAVPARRRRWSRRCLASATGCGLSCAGRTMGRKCLQPNTATICPVWATSLATSNRGTGWFGPLTATLQATWSRSGQWRHWLWTHKMARLSRE